MKPGGPARPGGPAAAPAAVPQAKAPGTGPAKPGAGPASAPAKPGAAAPSPAPDTAQPAPAQTAAPAEPPASEAAKAIQKRKDRPVIIPDWPDLPLPSMSKNATYPTFAELFDLMHELYDLLKRETASVDAKDFDAVSKFALRKAGLTRLYEESLLNLSKREDLKQRLTDEERQAVLKGGKMLRDAAEENMKTLQANISAVSQVIDTVVDVTKQMNVDLLSTYGDTGAIRENINERTRRSLSLNNKI
jgi:hypothetical protein